MSRKWILSIKTIWSFFRSVRLKGDCALKVVFLTAVCSSLHNGTSAESGPKHNNCWPLLCSFSVLSRRSLPCVFVDLRFALGPQPQKWFPSRVQTHWRTRVFAVFSGSSAERSHLWCNCPHFCPLYLPFQSICKNKSIWRRQFIKLTFTPSLSGQLFHSFFLLHSNSRQASFHISTKRLPLLFLLGPQLMAFRHFAKLEIVWLAFDVVLAERPATPDTIRWIFFTQSNTCANVLIFPQLNLKIEGSRDRTRRCVVTM